MLRYFVSTYSAGLSHKFNISIVRPFAYGGGPYDSLKPQMLALNTLALEDD